MSPPSPDEEERLREHLRRATNMVLQALIALGTSVTGYLHRPPYEAGGDAEEHLPEQAAEWGHQ